MTNIKTTSQPNHSMYFIINGSIFGPTFATKPATRKNRNPRPMADAITKGKNAIDNKPAVMVNSL